MEKAAEQQAAADVSGFQVVFNIPGRVSLGASEGAKSNEVNVRKMRPRIVTLRCSTTNSGAGPGGVWRRPGGGNDAGTWHINRGSRRAEINVVERVEELAAELKPIPLSKIEFLEQAEVK